MRQSLVLDCQTWSECTMSARSEPAQDQPMNEPLPQATQRMMPFQGGTAIGLSHRWHKGQYCTILTRTGIVGCGIYDLVTAAEFGLAVAIAKGTPAKPLVEPEDLLKARIVGLTPKAESFGIQLGMTGEQAVELMLQTELQEE